MRSPHSAARRASRPGRVVLAALALAVLGGSFSSLPAQPATGSARPLAVGRLADPRSDTGVASPALMATPDQPAGQQPLPPLPVTRLEERPRQEVLDAGRTFSLRVSEPVPVRDLLLLLVRDTRFSIVAAPGVDGTFVGELKDVTLKQALDLVLHPLGLEYAVDETRIRVFPRRVETRRFDVDYLATARTTRRVLGGIPAAGAAPAAAGAAVEVTATDRTDLFEELAAGVRTLLSPDGRFNLDRKAALLQVSDYPDRLDQIGLYLEAVHARATRQVAIHAWVVEVELDEAHAGGLDWRALLGDAPTVAVRSVPDLLAGLGRQGTVRVLATPRLVAMNNEPVVMRVGRQEVDFAPAAPQAATEGVTLSITPQISTDGFIQMNVVPSVTGREADPLGAGRGPFVGVREADTLVRVRDGETVVLGGFMQRRGEGRTDLVILLAPTLWRPGAAVDAPAGPGDPDAPGVGARAGGGGGGRP